MRQHSVASRLEKVSFVVVWNGKDKDDNEARNLTLSHSLNLHSPLPSQNDRITTQVIYNTTAASSRPPRACIVVTHGKVCWHIALILATRLVCPRHIQVNCS